MAAMRKASETWCPFARYQFGDEPSSNRGSGKELLIGQWNCCAGSACAMWSISYDEMANREVGSCGAAREGQILTDD